MHVTVRHSLGKNQNEFLNARGEIMCAPSPAATSNKQQATSNKQQATSNKQQA
jgi:hypothetical protein